MLLSSKLVLSWAKLGDLSGVAVLRKKSSLKNKSRRTSCWSRLTQLKNPMNQQAQKKRRSL